MRVWSPDTDKYSDTAPLRATLPTRPCAVYLYTKRRTQLLALDFDTSSGGQTAVEADLAQAISWITHCGGVCVTDRSTSGGRHLLVPLAIGTSASVDEIAHLMRLLATRLPTLDIAPNLGATEGCLTPPGSPCKQGGYRQLDGPLPAAREAFTTRSSPQLLPRLYVLLGALSPSPHTNPSPPHHHTTPYTVGEGDQLRLADPYIRHDPLPPAVHAFATHATLNATDRTWPTPSEARMSVIAHAVWRGHTLATITALIAPGRPWHQGLGAAYRRYHHHTHAALARDFHKALTWLSTNLGKDRPPQHKSKSTQGGQQAHYESPQLRRWLANGYAWADSEFRGQRYRWTVHAVLQTLAVSAARAGEIINGTPVVAVGGRSLSLGSGLLSPDTIWRTLRDLRDRPGSPVTLIRPHLELNADRYALTSQNQVDADPAASRRVQVADVHPAWSVLGQHLRRVYELVADHQLTNRNDIYAAARISKSTGNAAITELNIAGLIAITGRATVAKGPTTLDQIATAHHTEDIRQARIAEYRAERRAWRAWLASREHTTGTELVGVPDAPGQPISHSDHELDQAYLRAVLAHGPPPIDDDTTQRPPGTRSRADSTVKAEHAALQLLSEVLGAREIAPARPARTLR